MKLLSRADEARKQLLKDRARRSWTVTRAKAIRESRCTLCVTKTLLLVVSHHSSDFLLFLDAAPPTKLASAKLKSTLEDLLLLLPILQQLLHLALRKWLAVSIMSGHALLIPLREAIRGENLDMRLLEHVAGMDASLQLLDSSLLFLLGLPGLVHAAANHSRHRCVLAQRDRAVQHQSVTARVLVDDEEAPALNLHGPPLCGPSFHREAVDEGVFVHYFGLVIEKLFPIVARLQHWLGEEVIVEADLHRDSVQGTPGDVSLRPLLVRFQRPQRRRDQRGPAAVVRLDGIHDHNLLDGFHRRLLPGGEAKHVGARILGAHVRRVDPDFLREQNLVRPLLWVGREIEDLLLGGDESVAHEAKLARLKNGHAARRDRVENGAGVPGQLLVLDHVLVAAGADVRAERVQGLRRVAASPQAADRRHPRIVPALQKAGVHELDQLPLAQLGVLDVETAHFVDVGSEEIERPEHPVVGLSAVLKLQRADTVVDVLDRVDDAVRVVVGGVDAPLVSRVRVRREADAVGHLVPHVGVVAVPVHPQAEHGLGLVEHAATHVLEELEALLHGAVAIRAARTGQRLQLLWAGFPFRHLAAHLRPGKGAKAVLLDLVLLLVAHIGLSVPDEAHGHVVELREVLRRVRDLLRLPAHPPEVVVQALHILVRLGLGVGVVVAKHRAAAVLGNSQALEGQLEVHEHGLRVADVQIAIGLRREARAKHTGVVRLMGLE
eukprot:scaffold3058_cov232-Pinguiococcus_pyrenoidosus.AAC.6